MGNGEESGNENGNGAPATYELSDLSPESAEVEVGTSITVSVDIGNTGDITGTATVELSIGGSSIDSVDVELEGGESETVVLEGFVTSTLVAGEFEHTVSAGESEVSGTLTIRDGGGGEPTLTDAFVAESQGGLLAIGENFERDAEREGFALPPSTEVPEPIIVEGTIDGTTWESTRVDFPDLNPSALLDNVDDLPIDPSQINIRVDAPLGFSGTLDQQEEIMTVEGDLTITVVITGREIPITFNLQGTTETSGNLTGDIDLSSDPVTATVVDNEAQVPALDEGEFSLVGPIVNDELGLPSEEGETWVRIVFVIENVDG